MAKDEMTPVRCKIILALADNHMVVNKAAKGLYMDHSTVLYHIRMIKAITGMNPMDFYDLYELVQCVKGRGEL